MSDLQNPKSTSENILANKHWSILNGIEEGGFQLKNKLKAHKVDLKELDQMQTQSSKEDALLSSSVLLEEEEKVDAVLMESSKIETKRKEVKENLEQVFVNKKVVAEPQKVVESNKAAVDSKEIKASWMIENNNNKSKSKQVDADADVGVNFSSVKLVSKGIGKLYIKETSSLLNPISFIISNIGYVSVGLVQFVLPLLMTYLMITYNTSLNTSYVSIEWYLKMTYWVVLYFSAMFVCISGQVIISGLIAGVRNFVKIALQVGRES